ncbi:MAG: ferredoxin--NADP reductase [Chitinophagaceae bacterium]|nr:ferredoxin--NADP reductase [Chitinophagaceae bacterium]
MAFRHYSKMEGTENRLHFKIISVRQETADVKTFFLELQDPVQIHYRSGQFLTFLFTIYDKEVRRSYSLGSSPGIDPHLFITVKRKENGEFSRLLFDHFHPGDTLTALPPAGRFTLPETAVKEYVFIAAGTGIVPIYSLIKEAMQFFPETTVLLIYQNKNELNIIYQDELELIKTKHPDRLNIIYLFSSPKEHIHFPSRLNNNLLEKIIQQEVKSAEVLFYTCGPKLFMTMVEFTLRLMGYLKEQVKKENFVIDPLPVFKLVDTTPKTVNIIYRKKKISLQVSQPDSILTTALSHHIELPYSCRGGRCSSCIAICKSGKVSMSVNEVLTDKDLEKGYILTCVAHPETDVEIVYEEL